MVAENITVVPVFPQSPDPDAAQLLSPRLPRVNSDVYRLVVDSRLLGALEPVDDGTAWMVLPQAVHARHLAGCLVLTAD